MLDFEPITARTQSFLRPIKSMAFDCVIVVVAREGSAIILSELGQQNMRLGDLLIVGTNTPCAAEPEDRFTVTTISIDTDFLIDQVFWQHVSLLSDRFAAKGLVEKLYLEPIQMLHLSKEVIDQIIQWLDELTPLMTGSRYTARFNRVQALWFLIADAIAPFVKVSPVRLSRSHRERLRPTMPRHRRFVPLRTEALQVAELLRGDLARHWTVKELADRVHLSESQLARVFADAYGKTPRTYLTMLRVEELARLLRETDLLVDDAVVRVGWRNVSHAIRVFRAYIGMTPGAYRRTHNAVV
jgi:AraC-like DNA-binding protein